MDATAASESNPFIFIITFPLLLLLLLLPLLLLLLLLVLLLLLLRAGFAVAARGCATGEKCGGKEGNDGALGMLLLFVELLVVLVAAEVVAAVVVLVLVLVLVFVVGEVSMLELVLSVFTIVPLMLLGLWGWEGEE